MNYGFGFFFFKCVIFALNSAHRVGLFKAILLSFLVFSFSFFTICLLIQFISC